MPARAGIQEPQAEDMDETAWIPACAGMTLRLLFRATSSTDYEGERRSIGISSK